MPMNQEVIPLRRGLLAGIWPNQVPAVQGFYLGFAYGKINIPAIPRPPGGRGCKWLVHNSVCLQV